MIRQRGVNLDPATGSTPMITEPSIPVVKVTPSMTVVWTGSERASGRCDHRARYAADNRTDRTPYQSPATAPVVVPTVWVRVAHAVKLKDTSATSAMFFTMVRASNPYSPNGQSLRRGWRVGAPDRWNQSEAHADGATASA
jgi:hypothetical protein